MKWTFTHKTIPHTAEWRQGAMRCTMPEVIQRVDEIVSTDGLIPCGSAVNLVQATLDNEAGAFATITLAVQDFADFQSLKIPLTETAFVDDYIVLDDEDVDKAKSFGGDRSEAARYAARMRWGNRGGSAEIQSAPTSSGVVNSSDSRFDGLLRSGARVWVLL